jgi:signal transduction histidine kinase
LNALGDGVVATDTLGVVQELNVAAAHWLGTTRDKAFGRDLHEVLRCDRILVCCEAASLNDVFHLALRGQVRASAVWSANGSPPTEICLTVTLD